jgi:cytochrome c peroxidase
LFTDFSYDNIGIPKNPVIDRLRREALAPDLGLGVTVNDQGLNGAFKVMTLRNIAKTAPYGHNGYFNTLKEIVHFYNTRDVPEAGWPAPEVPENVNNAELGNLGLTSAEEDDIVAFLKTLSDGYVIDR